MNDMRKIKKIAVSAVLAWMLLTCCAGCTRDTGTVKEKVKGLDKLGEIHAVSREEGSGTRNTFAELAGFGGDTSRDKDKTFKQAEIAGDTSEVLNLVGADRSAIGYGSAGVMVSDDQIKVLSVDGISAMDDKMCYPLSRSFYLVWQGKCDLGMCSRELRSYEKELLNYEMIAKDEIAVIVNAKNPLENITVEQLEATYTGKTVKWEEVQ